MVVSEEGTCSREGEKDDDGVSTGKSWVRLELAIESNRGIKMLAAALPTA